MDFGKTINNGWRVIRLEKPAVRELADDPDGLLPGLLILAIAGALGGAATINPFAVVSGIVFAPLFSFVGYGILYLVAMLMGGKGRFMQYWQALASSVGLLSWVGVIPLLGALICLVWSIPVAVITTEEVHQMERGKAIAVVLIPFCLCVCAAIALGIMFGAAIAAAIAAARGH